jgi:hypothetical protein
MVLLAWIKLYGIPWDPRIILSILVHDTGYAAYACNNLDGEEGERHPYFGAKLMRVFGKEWYDFVLYHSRFLAKRDGKSYSKLCIADKLAVALTPAWMYIPLARATGEIKEYKALAIQGKYAAENDGNLSDKEWFRGVQRFLWSWAWNAYWEQKEKESRP